MPVRNEDPRITEIMLAVCGHFRVRRDDLYEDVRRGGPKNARDTAMYLVKEKTGCTWMHIERVFKRSECVVRKSHQRVNQILDKDKEHPVYVAVMKLRKRLHMEQDSGEDLDSSTG